ncbi:MAG: phosphoribosylanthranilate isomerase [Longimicrobiales bacterium]|nr:phosphoribosylanthranilate isomerase [Longimicrobiales bacterium]
MKICGVTRNIDARHAQSAGADLLGVVLSSGFGRSVPRASAGKVMSGTDLPRVAVLVDEAPAVAAALAAVVDASVLQLHGTEGRDTILALRDLGDWTVWKAVRARTRDDLERTVDEVGDVVDGILVEGWRKGVAGGGGARLRLGAEEVRGVLPDDVDFILAGGLTPGSVGEAVARFRPDVVDVSSGIERAPGVKSRHRVTRFVREARGTSAP